MNKEDLLWLAETAYDNTLRLIDECLPDDYCTDNQQRISKIYSDELTRIDKIYKEIEAMK